MPLHIIENGFIMLLIELILLIINGWRISVLYSTIMFKQMEFCSLISVMIWINPNFCFNFLLFLCADRRSWSCGIKYKASSQPVSLQVAYPLLILTLYLSSMDFNGLHLKILTLILQFLSNYYYFLIEIQNIFSWRDLVFAY